jgi:hypothetical protein
MNMQSTIGKLTMPALLLSAFCFTQAAPVAKAQASGSGYVSVQFSQNPVYVGQNVIVESSPLDACIAAHPGYAGKIAYYQSTSASGAGDYIGTDNGEGVVWNSSDGAYGENPGNYYFYGYYTSSGTVNGVQDPCVGVETLSSAKEWAELIVQE